MECEIDVPSDARAVPFGPAKDQLPSRFGAVYTYADLPLRVSLDVTFDGVQRARIERWSVDRLDAESLTPEDLASMRPASVMSQVVLAAMRPNDGPLPDDELFKVARVYWAHWVSWGKPRQALIEAFGLPRSTANYWIRKARDRHGLPGAWHAEENVT